MKKVVFMGALVAAVLCLAALDGDQGVFPGLFGQDPPTLRQIWLQKLKTPDKSGNNVLVQAEYLKEDSKITSTKELKIMLNDQSQLTLFDNGENGDEKPMDGIFTAPLRLDENKTIELINRNNEIIKNKQNVEMEFVGRSLVSRKLQTIDINRFREGLRVPLDLLPVSIVTAATLPGIRDKSLMITDLSVVQDLTRTYDPCRTPNKGNPNGVWSFNTLISNIANQPLTGVTTKQFLVDWVDNFLFAAITHPVSGDATTARNAAKARVIRAWIKNSGLPVPGGAGIPAGWQGLALKPEEFPVRLLAIVNRLDLRGNMGYGVPAAGVNAGEGRFVFCFVDSNNSCSTGNNGPRTMTFILEYAIPLSTCSSIKNYGQQWWNLRSMGFGAAYNNALQSITNVFTAANAMPSRTNKSALNHLRTNEFIEAPWVIRDFALDAVTKKLKLVHPNKEPMQNANGPAGVNVIPLVNFVNALPFATNPNPPYTIPANLAAMSAPMPGPGHSWRGSNANPMVPLNRREFSLNTCSGCHTRETNNIFTHVKPRNVGSAAALSGFMTGLGADNNGADNDAAPMGQFFVNDPGPTPLPAKQFNEALRRALDLERLVNTTCFSILQPVDLIAFDQTLRFKPLNMEH